MFNQNIWPRMLWVLKRPVSMRRFFWAPKIKWLCRSGFFFQNSAFMAGKFDLVCPGCKDNVCREKSTNEQRIKILILWEMENWISGAADRIRQHGAVMAFINSHLWPPASDVWPRDICKYTLRTNRCARFW